jgi:hypothetical protein
MTSVSLTSLINLLKLALGINMVRARIRQALAYQADPAKRGPALGIS